ncbi:hypothetical protein WR25_15125 [Diploscapter pachys]|uniref:Intraflagellar transport protein 57 homolog n=1 Tax=Diploscapter pachys TaxID=2018661 RepID=A0A2A2LMM8_9BILA|nr:hypothetical protein WR25_15125 [Diploscapter pachys]
MSELVDEKSLAIGTRLARTSSTGITPDFPANKLKPGAGEHALFVLDHLADLALQHESFHWEKMVPPPVEDDDVHIEEDEPDYVVDDDEDALLVDLAAPTQNTQENPMQAILKSDTDAFTWKQEVERVTPLLKITLRQDAKDWRLHLEQMNQMSKTLASLVEKLNPELENMAGELQKTLERIETREKSLNMQMGGLLSKFKQVQDKRAEMRERYKAASGGVSERTETLQRISEDIDQLKQQIEEQGAKTSDGAPMVKIKQAVAKLEEEIERMNVQIGVMEQSLLQAQLRDRVNYAVEVYGGI